MFQISEHFQTPPIVAKYMVSLIKRDKAFSIEHIATPWRDVEVLEPTPGLGNLTSAIKEGGMAAIYPAADFWDVVHCYVKFPYVVMNPPFNPVQEMERFVNRAMQLSDNVIALLPWTYFINSERRVGELFGFGLKSITHLPRKTFPGSRVQTAIFELKKGYTDPTTVSRFTW